MKFSVIVMLPMVFENSFSDLIDNTFTYSFYDFVSLWNQVLTHRYIRYCLLCIFIFFCKATVRNSCYWNAYINVFIRKAICTPINKTNNEIKCCRIIFICGDQRSWNKEISLVGRGVILALIDLLKYILRWYFTLVYVWHYFGIRLLGRNFMGKSKARNRKTLFLEGEWWFQGMNWKFRITQEYIHS